MEINVLIAYLSEKKNIDRREFVIETMKIHTHTQAHNHELYTKNIRGWKCDRFVRFLSICFIKRLQDNSGSISGSIGQREALCSGDDAFFQTILVIGTADRVRSSKWHREEITLPERADVVGGDDLFAGGDNEQFVRPSRHRKIIYNQEITI